MRREAACALCAAFAAGLLAAQGKPPAPLFFFGALSNSADRAIIASADNLFYNRLASRDEYDVVDKRDVPFSESALALVPAEAIVFYAEIMQDGAEWECTLHAVIPSAGRRGAVSRKYDTYYRILTDAQDSLAEVMGSLGGGEAAEAPPARVPTLAALAGNWNAGGGVNKVVILRGGKGFVIFKNGASMNIAVQIEGEQVVVSQTSKPNASFYPDLPREAALTAAETAPPIRWVLSLAGPDTLRGVQETLAPGKNAAAAPAELPALWQRQ